MNMEKTICHLMLTNAFYSQKDGCSLNIKIVRTTMPLFLAEIHRQAQKTKIERLCQWSRILLLCLCLELK